MFTEKLKKRKKEPVGHHHPGATASDYLIVFMWKQDKFVIKSQM